MTVDLQFFIQIMLGIAGFFGGFIMKNQSDAIKGLRMAQQDLQNRLQDYVPKDEFREFRAEQRDNFRQLFEKMDEVKTQIAQKVDRHEAMR